MKPFTRMFDRLRTPGKPDPEPVRPAEPEPPPRQTGAVPPLFPTAPEPVRLPDLDSLAPPQDDARAAGAPAAELPDPVAHEPAPAEAVEARQEAVAAPAPLAPAAEALAPTPSSSAAQAPKPVDWKVMSPAKPAKPAPPARLQRKARPSGRAGATLSTAMLEVAASSLASGMMAASGRRYAIADAITLLDQVRGAMRARDAGARKG